MPASRSLLLRLLGALAAVTLLTAACGGDDSDDKKDDAAATDGSTDTRDSGGDQTGGGGHLGDACDRISLAQMQTAFGFAWAEGESSEVAAGSAQCVWNDADPAPPAKVASLAVGDDDSFEEAFHQSAKQIYDSVKGLLSASDILEDDLGLGDDSYRTAGGIHVLDGDTSYSFSTTGGESDAAVAGLTAMATIVVNG